jgi:hypothetical protein
MAWMKTKIELPEDFDLAKSEREEVAVRILEYIKERTLDGVGIKNGRRFNFPKYSDAYIKSAAFKEAGKSASEVNLKLSGEMLEEMRILSLRGNQILIGFENGTFSNEKADGNSKKRPFLGINKSELQEILREFK